MIVTNLLGGLGNQMFQYAVGRSLSLEFNIPLKVDVSEFEEYNLRKYELASFCADIDIASKAEVNLLKFKKSKITTIFYRKLRSLGPEISDYQFRESGFPFNEGLRSFVETRGQAYLFGYWQSYKYFEKYRHIILSDFTLRNGLNSSSIRYQEQMQSCESVSLHVRRGDYISNPEANNYHGTCSVDYYKKAVRHFENSVKQPVFFIFSDDLEWAESELDFIENKVFVDLNANVPDVDEMILMSQCKHNIIANSSFSWWGAWMNSFEEKQVVAPVNWFADSSIDTSDLIPSEWLRF